RVVVCGGARVLALARRTPRRDPAERGRAVRAPDQRRVGARRGVVGGDRLSLRGRARAWGRRRAGAATSCPGRTPAARGASGGGHRRAPTAGARCAWAAAGAAADDAEEP